MRTLSWTVPFTTVQRLLVSSLASGCPPRSSLTSQTANFSLFTVCPAFFLGFPLWSLAPVSQQLASYLSRFASVNESKSDRLSRFTVIPGDVTHWASESREAFRLGDWWAGFLFLPNQEIWLPALFQNKSPVPYQWARLDFRDPFSGIFLVDGTGLSCLKLYFHGDQLYA